MLFLRISTQTWREVIDHLSAALPREGAGALVEREGTLRFVPLQNTVFDEAHFRLHPAEWVSLLYEIERNGERLAAIVHSHPNSPPLPSHQDWEGFHYPDSCLLIVSLANAVRPEAALYQKNGQRFERCPLNIE